MDNHTKKTILLVEDDGIIAYVGAKTIQGFGYEVLIAFSGEEAVEIATNNPTINLILLDIDLGKGIDVTEVADRICKHREIPIVFLSSRTEPEMIQKTEKIASYGYIVKGSSDTVLDASIKMAFKLFEANQETKATKEKLEATLDALPDLLFEIGLDGHCYDYHAPHVESFHKPSSEIIGQNITNSFPPSITSIILSAIQEAHEKGFSNGKQFEILLSGQVHWFEISVSPKVSLPGEPHFIILSRNITERKRTEARLQEITHELGERVKELNCLHRLSDLIEMSGESLEELMQGIVDLIPTGWQYSDITCARIIFKGQVFCTEGYIQTQWRQHRVIRANGIDVGRLEVCYLEARPEIDDGPFLQQEGWLLEIISERVGRVLEVMEAQRALRESEESLSITLYSIGDAVIATDLLGHITRMNKMAEKLTGWSFVEAQNQRFINIFNIVDPKTRISAIDSVEQVFETSGKTGFAGEFTLISRDGVDYQISESASPILDNEGIFRGVILVFSDITEKVIAEQKLREKTSELNASLQLIRSDLAMAQRIQTAMLASNLNQNEKLEIVVRYKTLSEVGGDFYCVDKIDETVTRVFLADATGHGVQAALIMMALQGIYDSIKHFPLPADKIIEIFNKEYIRRYGSLNSFLTCILVDIDTSNYKICFASAGHPAGLILKKDKEFHLLKNTGGLIGISPQKKYNLNEFSFFREDRLYIFTDGIFEQFIGDNDFGEERLYNLFVQNKDNTIDHSVDLVLKELETFLGDTNIQDDITLIGIGYRG